MSEIHDSDSESKKRNLRWLAERTDNLRVSYVPWDQLSSADLGDEKLWRQRAYTISNRICNFEPTSYEKEFFTRQLAMIVFDSNRMEGTISTFHHEGATIKKIQDYLCSEAEEPAVVLWNSEGGREINEASSNRQLYQAAKAAEYLFVQKRHTKLSLELIIEVHRIMMSNSYVVDRNNQVPITVGNVRTTQEVNAGFYQFCPSQHVHRNMMSIVQHYNDLLEEGETHPIDLATYLFYELITIHPFENGNGRLCRLFLAWSLLQDGFPFLVSFSSGHKSRRQHYMHAINRARGDYGHRGELNVILIVSIEKALANYEENLRFITNVQKY